jgi:hypothetical protein
MSTARSTSASLFTPLHDSFLAILPRIITHGQVYFRFLVCPVQQEDAIAEMVALAWKWHVRLARRGKDSRQFASAVATYAARAVSSGLRVTGMEKAKDALSLRAQRRHHFIVKSFSDYPMLTGTLIQEALRDNMQTPVPDQAAFRHDFPAWRLTRTHRDRRILDSLMLGERPLDVSRMHGLSPGRISQLRQDFHEDWNRFCADPAALSAVAGPSTSR